LIDANKLAVLVVPCDRDNEITQRSSIEEVIACPESKVYKLGEYFQAQNDEVLGEHWSFLINVNTNEELTGLDVL